MAAAVQFTKPQIEWARDPSRFKIGMFARQTGKTFTTTWEIVDDCHEAIAAGRRARWVILSRGERQAKEAMNEGVKLHCKAYNLAIESLEYEYRGDEGTYNALEVGLPGGSTITALPANPDTARGFSSNVFLDEFAFHKDSRAIWGALFPVISKPGLKLRVVSTPNGKGNKFYELMTAKGDTWSKHTCDIYQAVAAGLPRNIEELKAGLNDQDLWEQEYELKWLDEALAWLSFELINAVEDDAAGNPELSLGGEYFIGNDIGLRSDLWVAWVWEKVGDIFWCREIRTLHRKKFKIQDQTLDELVDKYKPTRIAMDQTGMGEKPVEDAKERYGEFKVEGVLFTSKNKHLLATMGKEAFEDRKVRIPSGDIKLRADLHKLRKLVTPMGNVRFDADSDSAGHADRTWAAFLGLYAGANFVQPAAGSTVESANKDTYAPQAGAGRRRMRMGATR